MFARSLVVGAIVWLIAGTAGAVDRVGWEDLAPTAEATARPFQDLTEDQLYDLYDIVRIHRISDTISEEWKPTYDKARSSLEAAGLDVDALLARYEKLRTERARQDETLVEELDGKQIQIPGYALPIEFSGTTMTEFLLVPYVGACIHTPPPPPNQIVYVRVPEGFESNDLYTPVWVTGRITTTSVERSLSYVDGVSDISVGYSMQASKIEPYE